MYLAQRGIAGGPLEIWEIAAVLGLHRPDDRPMRAVAQYDPQSGLMVGGAADYDDAVAEMFAATMREQQTGEKAEWGAPTAAELATARALNRGDG